MDQFLVLDRRDLLKKGIQGSAGCLMIAVVPQGFGAQSSFIPNHFIEVPAQGKIKLICHRSEMGQGARTACAMLLAEELKIPWDQIEVKQAPGDVKYGDQNTDGSTTVRKNWDTLRLAGASARETLLAAAASYWKTSNQKLIAKNGSILNVSIGESLKYQELVEASAKIPVVKNPKISSKPDSYDIIGKPTKGVDVLDIVTGKASYGIDKSAVHLVYASVARSPVVGGGIESFQDKEARKLKGVLDVFQIDEEGPSINSFSGVVVVAQDYWTALKGRNLLKINWSQNENVETTSKTIPLLKKQIDDSFSEEDEFGNFEDAKKSAKRLVKGRYFTPYLTHAPMEPPVATASLLGGHLTIWAPTQDPQRAREAVADATGLDEQNITINVTLLGGGFGRKSQPDFVVEAALIAQHIKKPVKVIWTREDDIRHGFYHAQAIQTLEATIDQSDQVSGWRHRSGFPSIAHLFTNLYFFGPSGSELEMGMINVPYQIPNRLFEKSKVESEIKIGWLRSVCNVFHAFAIESFMDDIATTLKTDPIELRLKYLSKIPPKRKISSFDFNPIRLKSVIQRVREISHWNDKRKKGIAIGFACHASFKSYVAVAVEMVKDRRDKWSIRKAYISADCGVVINPNHVKAQLEGSVVFGISVAFYGRITLTNGQVDQSNFHDYPVLRMDQCPDIVTDLMPSNERPTGIGEPGVPPISPAIANALFAGSGVRVRDLPLVDSGLI